MAARKPPAPKPQAPEEALKWFSEQVPFTRDERNALDAKARKQAFFVSNVAQLRLVSDVHKAVTSAIAKGTTLADFKRAVEQKLTDEWGKAKPAVVETIFRTNVQAAYNAGRLEQFDEPLVKHFRPYRGWSVVVDNRTTEHICLPLRSLVVPANSAFANSHVPPLHFRCRTGILALSAQDAGESVKAGGRTPHVPVQEGFGGDPHKGVEASVDVSSEPPALQAAFREKVAQRGHAAPGGARASADEPPEPRRAAPRAKAAAELATPQDAKPAEIKRTAAALPEVARPFEGRAFISEVASALGFDSSQLEAFKRHLDILQAEGKIHLSRVDLREVLSPVQLEMLEKSETRRAGTDARFHLIRFDR